MPASGISSQGSDDVLVVRLENPPSNALHAGLRAEVIAVLEDPGLARAVVLVGAGASFSSAFPLEHDAGRPSMSDLCRAVVGCRVPVVAALNGPALGPGAELAVAAAARVAGPAARIAFPEIAIGLPPGAGASQRLPGLVGPEEALRLLISGRAVAASDALAIGLVDAVVEGDLLAAAIAMARRLVGPGGAWPRPAGEAKTFQAAIATARVEHRAALPAVRRIIDCVEAALLLPLANGLELERVAREDLEAAPETAALRSAALAERRALTLPPMVARARSAPVQHVGLYGSGEGMARLALAALGRGMAVTWQGDDAGALADAMRRFEARGAAQLRAGRLTRQALDVARRQLTWGTDPAALEGTGLQVHALVPTAALGEYILPGVPLLVMGGAEGALGLDVAASGRVSELALPVREHDPALIATAVATLREIGLPPVLVGQRPVLGLRVTEAGDAALARVIGLGVSRQVVMAAMQVFGLRIPAGTWPDGGQVSRPMSEPEVQRRWLGAMANEGLKQLGAGIARRPSDIDHLLVAGHQFPRGLGGPMHQADQRGLLVLRHDLRTWAQDDPFWTSAPLIDRLISEGVRLSALDG